MRISSTQGGLEDILEESLDLADADIDAFVSQLPLAESVTGDVESQEHEDDEDEHEDEDAGYKIVAAWHPKTKRGVANVISYVTSDANFTSECTDAPNLQHVFDQARGKVPDTRW